MSTSHFNFQTMTAYRKNKAKRGYNPFDYPEEWEFFIYPFEVDDEEDDILTNLLFQIRKTTRRLHLYFEEYDYNRLETAFFFGLLDSLSEAEDYLLGALKYARYCRLENLFFLAAAKELEPFLEKLNRLQDELLEKIRSFGGSIVELNKECYGDNLFLHQYCALTQQGIPSDMLHALLRAPNFPFGPDKHLIIDKNTDILSYLENVAINLKVTKEERNIEGACDSSEMDTMLDPVDKLLWYIRGTLLWVVIKKIMMVCSNATALANRHNKLVETMCQDAYKEVCDVYAHSKAYAKRRDEELPRQCGEELFLQGRKPTDTELHTYFNTQYRNYIQTHNESQRLFLQYRKQENTFCLEFLKLLLDEDKREDAEDFLFFQTFGKELSLKQSPSGKMNKDSSSCEPENQQQTVCDKYQKHYLMRYVHEDCKDKVLRLLEKLEAYRVEGSITNGEIDKYEFDFKAYKKNQIFDVCKEIRSYLSIGKNVFGQYLLENTNLRVNTYSPDKPVTLETILNQI